MTSARFPRSVPLLTAGLASVAVVVGVRSTTWPIPSSSLAGAPLLFVALVVAGVLPIVYTARDDHDTMDLFEAALTPVVLLLPGIGAVALASAAKLVSLAYLRVAPMKVAFNVAQWGCVAAVASAVYRAIGDGSMQGSDIAALAVAMTAGMVVNRFSVVTVIALASRRPFRAAFGEFKPMIVPAWIVGGAINLSFGLLFAALAESTPAATPIALVPLVTLFWANRSYAHARADRVRLEGLQRATHELAATVDPLEDCTTFLDIVRSHFESDEVELVLLENRRIMRSGTSLGPDAASLALAEVVAALGTTVRATATHDDNLRDVLTAKQRRDCVAAPLRRGSEVVGALVSYGREGLEGFEQGETAVLEALAAEAMSALHRGELLAQLVDEKGRYRDIVARSSDGIFSVTVDGIVDSWNPAMEAVTGFGADVVVGHTLAPLHATDSEGGPVGQDRWMSAASLPADLQILTSSGETKWLGCSYSRTSPNDSLVVVARDITTAKALDRLKDDFVATVSHELRTPMTSIRGFTQMLLESQPVPTEDMRNQALTMIRKGVQRLDRLVLNLLQVARIDTGAETPTHIVDLVAAARDVIEEHQESWPDRTITLRATGPVHARANDVSFEQVLANLVSNALKYAPSSPVEIGFDNVDGSAVVTVTDHGPGIPKAEHSRIFQRFERLDRSTSQAGTGLGLYIAFQLTRTMGGDLTLTSELGHGATFTIRLPASHLTLVSDSRSA